MTAPTSRHRHQIALAAAANLFTRPVPDAFTVRITYDHVIDIMPRGLHSLDSIRIALHQWAALLENAQWSVKPHTGEHRMLAVEGTWLGQKVKVWKLIPIDGPGLAELSTPPHVDTVAGAL
jgi:hypothetical protein